VTAVTRYQTALEAASAGYPPAPPPADVLEVGGVCLAPTSASFQARCRRAADRLGLAVPCPGLLPIPAPGVPPPRLCEEPPTCQRGRFLRFQWDGFQIPIGYRGPVRLRHPGHRRRPTGSAGRFLPPCPDERRVAAPTVHQILGGAATCAVVAGPSTSDFAVLTAKSTLRFAIGTR
jgi:hypothetical protein